MEIGKNCCQAKWLKLFFPFFLSPENWGNVQKQVQGEKDAQHNQIFKILLFIANL